MHKYTDERGINWQEFTCSYTHELDGQEFSFTIWAVDFEDAQERLKFIGSNGTIDGELDSIIPFRKTLQ